MATHKHRLQYRLENGISATRPSPWSCWSAHDKCRFVWYSNTDTGGLWFRDERPKEPETWQVAGAERFPPCPDIDRFKVQLRAFFVLWGGRTGPNIPAARRQARRTVR